MARITLLFLLSAALAVPCAFGASAETASNKPSSSSNSKTSTSSNTSAPAQRINNVVNYNAVPVRSNPGPVNRVTPSGTRPMTPNAPARSGGLHTNPVPSPTSTSSNARYNSQKRNVNPTGDKSVAAGFDANQKRYQANQPKPNQPKPTTTTSTARSWPGATRPASAITTPSVSRSTTTASAVVSRPSPPPPSRSYSTSSSSSTAASNSKKN